MSFSVIADNRVLRRLSTLIESKDDFMSVGLLIGHVNLSKKKVYILYPVPTPEQSKDMDLYEVGDVDPELIADHSRYVTRMLPGGFSVLGLYFVSRREILIPENFTKLIAILSKIINDFDKGFFLDGKTLCHEYYIFHYRNSNKTYVCKSVSDTLVGNLLSVDMRFNQISTSWIEIQSEIEIDSKEFDETSAIMVKEQLMEFLAQERKTIEKSSILLNDQYVDKDLHLDSLVKGIPNRVLTATLCCPHPPINSDGEIQIFTSKIQRHIVGTICSRTFVDPYSTIADATKAVKQDIVRSLGARLEMHWDSLTDEEGTIPEDKKRIHEPPRRVLIKPPGWRICLSDYLFPGEEITEAAKSLHDIFDIDVTVAEINDTVEGAPYISRYSAVEKPVGIFKGPLMMLIKDPQVPFAIIVFVAIFSVLMYCVFS